MTTPPDRPSFPPAVLEALRKGNKLEAIKLLRDATKKGLAEAKAQVEAAQRAKNAGANPVWKSATSPSAAASHPRPSVGAHAHGPVHGRPIPGYVPYSKSGLSPGEVPRAGGQYWWILVLIVGLGIYFAVR